MSTRTLLMARAIMHLICVNSQIKEKLIDPQYLFKDFTSGDVFLKDSSATKAKLNYNTLTQEMLFKKDTVILKLDMPNLINSVAVKIKFSFLGAKYCMK